jgi:hypothetical protein
MLTQTVCSTTEALRTAEQFNTDRRAGVAAPAIVQLTPPTPDALAWALSYSRSLPLT